MPTIAACSWSLRTASPDELADALARCGLDAVQLALVPCAEEPSAWGRAVEALRASLAALLATAAWLRRDPLLLVQNDG